ncbi:MAG: YigZ family protein [Chloroflexota bacterium]|nr:YigZ family protein [Chloroflexota bacterium]NOG64594.1 YigZ family protein [Chloroflexota bacterium]GIK63407.1 MAG: YigZ family protein [Chloroflexota bacterium]
MVVYPVPKERIRIEYQVSNSRFFGTIGRADTIEQAKTFIQTVRDEMPDATHHVYAFKIGYGGSVTEGMSDDGEPSGTAGPPALAVIRGSNIGDVVLVITRYFGGTKLGTGGLVHAYGQTAREAVSAMPTELKTTRRTVGIEIPYALFERVKILMSNYDCQIETEDFGAEILLILRIAEDDFAPFTDALRELTAGRITPLLLDE